MKPFKAAVHRAGARAEAELREHPTEAELLDFLDELPDEKHMAIIRDHLTWCRACTAKLKAMDVPLGFEIDPQLKELPFTTERPPTPIYKPRPTAWLVPVLTAAAAFLLAMFLFRPGDTNPSGTSMDLALNIGTRGARSEAPNRSDTMLILRLELPGLLDGDYVARFLDTRGNHVFAERGSLRPSGSNRLVITYPLPESGRYEVVVTDPSGDERRYPFTIEPR